MWCWVAVVVVMLVRGSDGSDDVIVTLTVKVAGVVMAIVVVFLVLVMVVNLLWFGVSGVSILDDNVVKFAGDWWLTTTHALIVQLFVSSLCVVRKTTIVSWRSSRQLSTSSAAQCHSSC